MLLDDLRRDQLFQIVALHLVEAPEVERILVVDLGRFFRKRFATLFGSGRSPLSTLLCAPCIELLADAEIAVVEKEDDAKHRRADDQVAPRTEFEQDVAQEDDHE